MPQQWGAWGEIGAQAGSEASGFLEGFMPLGQDGSNLVFLDMRLDYGDNSRGSSSFGLGLRSVVGSNLIVGANSFIDVVHTDNGNYHLGATLGLEAFTSIFDLRLNAHIPLQGRADAGSFVGGSGVSVVNNQIVENRVRSDRREALLYGLTAEIGAMFDSPFADDQSMRAYAGAYVYDRNGFRTETGARLGLEYQIHDVLSLTGSRFTLGAELVYDRHDKLDAVATARLRIPLFGGDGAPDAVSDRDSERHRLLSRMDESVRRDKGIRVGTFDKTTSVNGVPVVNPATGTAYGRIYFASQGSSGTGSAVDPTALATAVASAGAGGIIVAMGDDGTITTSGVTLQNGQTLIGGGQTIAVQLADGTTTSFLLAGTAGTIDGDPGVTTVTVTDGVTVRGLTIQGGSTVIGGNNVTGATLTDLSIQNATDGIRITNASGTTLNNLSFSGITGTSIFLNNEAASLSGITINGGTNGISIANNTGTTTLSDISVTGVSGDALSFANNTGVINVVDFTATNTGDDAVVISGAGTYGFSGGTTISGLGAGTTSDGIDLSGTTNATLTFGDVDITGLGGGTGLNMAGADATVTMSSLDVTGTGVAGSRGVDISGTQNGRTISIVNGGTISNVGTGLVLGTSGAALAAPDAVFTWGGGDIGGLAFALDGVGVNAANGSYSFGSTGFTGGFNFTTSGVANYFIAASATGAGDGSSTSDRATIATAIAAAAGLGTVNFILINDGSEIDTSGLTFALADNQTIDTFGDGRTFSSTGYVIAANITGSNLPSGAVTITDPTGNGAATLTSSSGAVSTIQVANGNTVRNITVGSTAGTAISGSGITGLTIEGVTIGSGGTTAQNGISLTNTSGTVTMTNVSVTSSGGSGLSLTNAGGTVTGNNVDITGSNALTVSGGDAAISFNASSSISNSAGNAVSISGRIGGSFSHFGSVTSNGATAGGISVSGGAASNVTFGGMVSLGTTTALTTGTAGILLDTIDAGTTVAFDGGLDVATNGITALSADSGSLRVSDATTERLTATGAAALLASNMTLNASFDAINATNTAQNSVTLSNLDGALAINGGTLDTLANAGAFNSVSLIQNDTGATRKLKLTVDGMTIRHDATVYSSANEYGIYVETRGDDQAEVAISNSTFQTEDSSVRVMSYNSGSVVTAFADNTLLGDATSARPDFFNNGIVFDGVIFDGDTSTAGLQTVNGGTLTIGTASVSASSGLFFLGTSGTSNTAGRIDFSNYTAYAFTSGLQISGDQSGLSLGIGSGAITAATVALGSSSTVAGSGGTGDITLSSLTLTQNNGNGLSASRFGGSFTVTGATSILATERSTIFGADYYRNVLRNGIAITDTTANFSFGDITIGTASGSTGGADVYTTGGSTVGISLENNSGTFTSTGTVTITDTVEDAIRITGTSGAISFNRVSVVNPHAAVIPTGTPLINPREAHSAGIDISGTIGGTISFNDLDIALNSDETTGIELTGATLNAAVTANDFDVTGNGSANTIGVDLRGTTGGGTVRLGDSSASGESSSIAGVKTGVWLDSSTNAIFTFGDGENGTDQGSTISANTAIDASSAPTVGSYDFRDVNFTSSPGLGFGTGDIYFVDSDGATGGGDGSGSDASNPMTLAAAEAAAGAGDIIVLINNGSAINVAGTNGNDTLNLLNQMQLLSFGDGAGGSQSVTVSLTVPPTILLSAAGLTIADPTNNGGAVVSSTGTDPLVGLGSAGNRIAGVILDGGGTTGTGISGASSTGLTVDRSIIRNFTGTGISITTSTGTQVSNASFSGNANDISLGNASGSSLSNITSTGATGRSIFFGASSGANSLNNVSIASVTGGTGLYFLNAGGTFTGTNVDISGTSGNALYIEGGDAAYSFDAASSIDITSGGAVTLLNIAGGSLTHAGTVTANGNGASGIAAAGATGAYSVSFTGAVDLGTTTAIGGSGVSVGNNGQNGTFSFADLDINTDGGFGILMQNGGSLGITTGSLAVTNAQGLSLAGSDIAAGGITLTSFSNTSAGTPLSIGMNGVSGGAFTVTGTTTISGTTSSAISMTNVSANVDLGTVNLTLAGGDGFLLNGNSGTLTAGDTTIDMAGGSGNAVRATNANGNMTFGNVDVVNVGAGTGLNLSGGTFDGQITFATLDITGNGTAGSKGINLTGYDNTKNVVTTGSSAILNVQTGIDFTNANIANGVRFQYGDGDATNPGTESTIDTTGFALVTTGMGATGEYDLEDVAFGTVLGTTNTSNLSGPTYYVVGSNGSTGAGNGTFLTPGTIAGAEASGANAIILVDNNADTIRDVIDVVAQDDGTFTLADGQALVSMVNGETVDLATLGLSGGGAPASLKLTGISSNTQVTASGNADIDSVRAILTSNAAGGTVALAGTATIQNTTIRNTGSGDGVSASYSANATARIRSSQISGGGGGAYAVDLATSAGTSSVELSDAAITGGMRLDGSGGGTLTTTATGTNTIADGGTAGGLDLNTVVIGAAGFTFDSLANSGSTGNGVRLQSVSGTGTLTVGSVSVDNAANYGIYLQSSSATINLGTDTSGTGVRLGANTSIGSAGIYVSAASGTINIGNASVTSLISAGATSTSASGVSVTSSDAAITLTSLDITRTGTGSFGSGIYVNDTNASGSVTLNGTNRINNTGGDGVLIQGGNVSLSNLTLGDTATGTGDDITQAGIRIAHAGAVDNTISLSNITMGGAAGDTGDIAGRGINVTHTGTGILTVNLSGTNVIRTTGQAFVVSDTAGTVTPNSVRLALSGTTFETVTANQPTVSITGQNLSPTSNSVQVRGFANNVVTGNGTSGVGGGIRFEKVDFDSDGAGATVSAGTLNVGQGTTTRVAGTGVAFIDTTGAIDFATLNIYNNNGTGLQVDTKTNGLNTDFTMTGGGSGTVDTTNGTALFLDPLTMNLSFSSVRSTSANGAGGLGSGVFIDAGNASGGAASQALNIGTLSVTGSSGAGLRITNSTGTFNFGATTINNAGSTGGGVDLDLGASDTATVNFTGALDIDTSAGTGFDANATSGGALTLNVASTGTQEINTATGQILRMNDVTIGGTGVSFDTLAASGTVSGDAVRLFDVDGGAFNGGAVSVVNTSAAGNGIVISGFSTSTFNFTSATIDGAAGAGILLSGANGAVTFDTVDIDGTGDDGVEIANTHSAVTINGGSIGATNDPAGIAVDINGGSANVTIAADITKTTANDLIEISGRSAGTVTFSGNLSATGAAGGIQVTANNNGTINFSGGTKTLNTGANTAVSLTNNSGMTVNFTGGGLDIDTTSGAGFVASNSGTVTVQGTGNTVSSTGGGRGVDLSSTTIGASGVTLQSVSTNGADRAVSLVNTGTTGIFSVTGSGSTDGSGGTLVNSTDTGIWMQNTGDVRFANMQVNTSTNFAVRGQTTAGVQLTNVDLIGNHGNGANEGGVYLSAASGTVIISGGTYRGGFENAIDIDNTGSAGTLTLTISGATIFAGDDSTAGFGNDALLIEANAGTINGTITNNIFAGALGDHIQIVVSSTANLDLDIGGTGVGNTFQRHGSNPTSGGAGVNAGFSGSGTIALDILDNDMSVIYSAGSGISPVKIQTTSTFSGTLTSQVRNNTIGTAGAIGSGAGGSSGFGGYAMQFLSDGGGTASYVVSNNIIRDYNDSGIRFFQPGGGTQNIKAVITGNQITYTSGASFPVAGIEMDAGNLNTGSMCAEITGNTVTDPKGAHTGGIYVTSDTGHTFNLVGTPVGSSTGPAIAGVLNGTNTLTAPSFGGSNGSYNIVAACP
ncbi:beta strand repeat-containing protein [Stappia sp.]|uniref:beta strand repeat-containing protein n=1 Tax=Stappia sp. TaxID=1870903 RepID=UPI003A993161